ncbi:translation elongation factor Ts [Gammaproteobacteria bacterium]|nr:translation elongation factor Ts [Gammaproteobacteria bacterium]
MTSIFCFESASITSTFLIKPSSDKTSHIAFFNSEDISKDVVEKEKEIIEAQVSDSDKPQEIIEKMISGRLNKFLSEVSLVDQPFVKDPSIKISELLKNNDNSVLDFIRYEVGEGIEVEKKDFAEEVQAQLDS